MSQELNDYLTGEEKRQMDKLMAKAEERKRERREEDCKEHQVLVMGCQFGCGTIVSEQQEENNSFPADMEKLFGQICGFCKKYNMCQECCEDELPFP